MPRYRGIARRLWASPRALAAFQNFRGCPDPPSYAPAKVG